MKKSLVAFLILCLMSCSKDTPDSVPPTREDVLKEHNMTEEDLQRMLDEGQVPPFSIPPPTLPVQNTGQ